MQKYKNIIIQNLMNGIAKVILNDPKTYNSLSFDTINSLINALTFLNNDINTKVIIIEGVGKGFCAGHNLKEIQSLKNKSSYQKLFNRCSKLMLDITNHKKPIIAKIHGAAFAAGCQLVASCDLAYSTKDSIFSTPGVNIGLFCSTPMVALSRKVNRKQSMKMLLTGEPINAIYAKDIGLINDYFSSLKLDKEVINVAKLISSKSSLVLKIGKRAFYNQLEMPIKKAYQYTSKIMTENMMKVDAQEGIDAFVEKRVPKWKNK
jgi:enoyl-CoA hydratase/carnithine racemase|tara:strand:+ start:2678 stop:3463 length:786 start_codon:yes stop_codon:yes gene_type:complete